MGFRGLGLRVWGLGFRVLGLLPELVGFGDAGLEVTESEHPGAIISEISQTVEFLHTPSPKP